MSHSQSLHLMRGATVACAATMVVACGGGGGGSSGGANPPPGGGGSPSPTTGTVAVVLRDFPNDEFCRIYADVERIEMLGQEGRTVLVEYTDPSGDGRHDLLDLQGSGKVLDVATDVPIGEYGKVRMTLDQLSLVRCTDESGLVEQDESDWEHPKIPGNGKLDLVPRETINVIGGATLVIDIDMDMKKSLHLHQTGQGNGKWQFRPVIFVDVMVDIDETKLVRVFGEVRDSDAVSTFELCPVGPMGSGEGNGNGDDMGNDDDSGRCLDVFVRDGSGAQRVFTPGGDPVGFPDHVTNGAMLTAIGFLGLHDDDDDADSDEDDFRLDGVVLHLGPKDGFESLMGSVATELLAGDVFGFDTDTSAPAVDALVDVEYQLGPILEPGATPDEVGPEVILPGAELEVNGVFTDPTTDPKTEPFKASLIVFKAAAPPPPPDQLVGGTITSIVDDDDPDPLTREIGVTVGSDPESCVRTVEGTRYLEIDETGPSSITTEIGFDDLEEGDLADVFGTEQSAGDPPTTCIVADTIQKYVTAP